MLHFHKAGLEDILLIRELAERSFLPTYKDILSVEQLEWMFDWMYSCESLREQLSGGARIFYCL